MKKETVFFRGKKIDLIGKEVSVFGRFSGLMFKTKNTGNLIFNFPKGSEMKIHSFFVFFDFLALWLDDKNNLIESKIIRPFTPSVKPRNKFIKLIEIPLNRENKEIVKFFVGKEK